MRLFLDANVIFSAALGGESFTQLWSLRTDGRVTFCTSPQCVDEARRNLTLKKPHALARLEAVFLDVELVDPPLAPLPWADGKLPEDDASVVAAAVGCGANVLLTGNTRHFRVDDDARRFADSRAHRSGVARRADHLLRDLKEAVRGRETDSSNPGLEAPPTVMAPQSAANLTWLLSQMPAADHRSRALDVEYVAAHGFR